LDRVLGDAKTLLRFLTEVGYLNSASDGLTKLITHLDRIQPRFKTRMTDPRRYSQGKRIGLAMTAEGIMPDQTDAVQAWIERFNGRSRSEREALLGTLPTSLSTP
jgi:hypothetical protein